MKISDLKNIKTKIKNLMNGLNCRMETEENQ